MYEKITEQKAEEVAQTMIDRMQDEHASTGAVVNKNWEASLEAAGDGKATLYIYERLDENAGFILSSIFACACTVDSIADALRNHINACIDEWIAEDVAEQTAEMPDMASEIEENEKGASGMKSTVFSFLPEGNEEKAKSPVLAVVTVAANTNWQNFKNEIDDSISSYMEGMPDTTDEKMIRDVLSESGAVQFEIIHPIEISL